MIHFISGLPRSGSTLLAALLRQNPRFSAHIQTPLGQLVTIMLEGMSTYANESALFCTDEQRTEMLRGIFSGYYRGYPDVVFDSNRRWCANMVLVRHLFPNTRVIACVRPLTEIIGSFERLFARDPTQISRVLSATNTSVYDRVARLMAPQGVVGYSWNATRDAYFGLHRDMLCVVEFAKMITNPLSVLKDLHKAINEPWFDGYDPDHVESVPGTELFDAVLGTPGMHDVQSRVGKDYSYPTIQQDVAAALPPPFWG